MQKRYNWPLGISTMTWRDKWSISKFLFTESQWTMGRHVEQYEKSWKEISGAPYVVAVSSGSTANHLIALWRKEEIAKESSFASSHKVLFNSVGWISSVSPFVHIGFYPIFVDIGHNLCPSVDQIVAKLDADPSIRTVFYTTLLGHSCDLPELNLACHQRRVRLMLDNCEASFSQFSTTNAEREIKTNSFNNLVTCSTSCYISHFTSGGQELGLIFCQSEEEYEFYRMMRNHGMTRGMPDKYRNYEVDASFDFACMGTNFRTTNLLTYMASLDLQRAKEFTEQHRNFLEEVFLANLDPYKYTNRHLRSESESKFYSLSIPIVINKSHRDKKLIYKVKAFLEVNGVGVRPIVGGCLPVHTAFRRYADPKNYPEAMYVHENGCYIGLHEGVTESICQDLAKNLNAL